MNNRIEIGIPTCNRHDYLAALLVSLKNQTYQNFDITVIDQGLDESIINNYLIMTLMKVLKHEGHDFKLFKMPTIGPQHAHNKVLETTKNPYIFRVDDDIILDSNYLEGLVNTIEKDDKIGAAAGLIIHQQHLGFVYPKNYMVNPFFANKNQKDPTKGYSLQWSLHPDNAIKEVDHLYSSFIYRVDAGKRIGGFRTKGLSRVAHHEETDFSYSMHLAGYKLMINPNIKAFHFRAPTGGIRTNQPPKELWDSDHQKFISKFNIKD